MPNQRRHRSARTLTNGKLTVARCLFRLLRLAGVRPQRVIRRGGIRYAVDLREGIDLMLFLTGSFQPQVYRNAFVRLPPHGVVLDVGANCGTMALPFARLVPQGKVYAFEPTHYGFARLQKNLRLNPALSSRIVPVQTFVMDTASPQRPLQAFASWKVDGTGREQAHPVHGGLPMATDGVGVTTLDQYCLQVGLPRVDCIKIDTDGYEWEVLQGALVTLAKFQPVVIFEFMRRGDQTATFQAYHHFFLSRGYALYHSRSGKRLSPDRYCTRHWWDEGCDVVAVPAAANVGKP